MQDELLTAEELAIRLRVQPDTIRAWTRQGVIPAIRPSAKVIRYDANSVIESLKRRQAEQGGADDE